jgi:FkbM family methyltransferase
MRFRQKIKSVVREGTPPFLWRAMKQLVHRKSDQSRYFGMRSQGVELDRRLERYLDFDNGFFVELGAFDGVYQSNSNYFERSRGWRGILVEPSPENFLLCRQNRAEETRVYCAACVSFDYELPYVEIVYKDTGSTPVGLESDIPDPLVHTYYDRLAPEQVPIYGAKARTLQSILEDSNVPKRVDFLSLDVEGAELEVLRGVDHSAFRFRYCCIESRSFDKLQSYMTSINYKFVEKLTAIDYLFVDDKNLVD